MSSINLVNNSILASARQENNKSNNFILSTEEFPDASRINQFKPAFSRKSTILQKQASFIQNSRDNNLKSLKHQPSKLDLIDDTKLTSLPLPPPPKTRNSCSQPDADAEHGIRCSESVTTYNIDDEYDEEIEESEDPIVLVEDYMTSETIICSNNQKHINKKDSLAIFKDRIYQNEDNPSISTTSAISTITSDFNVTKIPLKISCVSKETMTKTKITRKEQDLEEIFGKIPGSDSLKYCDLCEKPLYEISSLIDNKIETSLERPTDESLYKEDTRLYSEFVCWECVETYEEFFNELCANELYPYTNDVVNDTSKDCIKLFEIFQDIKSKYNIDSYIETKLNKQENLPFSSNLIQKLNQLKGGNSSIPLKLYNGSETFDWIKYLQYQLRWRWRIAGLIPNAFRSDPNQT
ncbi:uncharacterized protein AC631_02645 [Debaryomyces fabryi]|uniref:Uncharacterized protein n=1 Tax=Debaryomyces fabryi TaxID=58627 RepID=A0A0V1PZH6_9ASCO|nr:uncharacterized protein AC631_02645 [Debaryomyces fabryi]KSA01570.1 hypothetical protein AC631_02645 [Debaryomyces fabryi]CUM49848.1 unnamed protein product [Debaryomyces fabryi]